MGREEPCGADPYHGEGGKRVQEGSITGNISDITRGSAKNTTDSDVKGVASIYKTVYRDCYLPCSRCRWSWSGEGHS